MSQNVIDTGIIEREPRTGGQSIAVSWDGNPWSLAGLCLLNFLLTVITVGIYWFWARSEYRRHMWQMVRVEGEPLEYTGTGKELLIGYLLFFLFAAPFIAAVVYAQLVLGPTHPLFRLTVLAAYAAGGFLLPLGIFRAHRYILSRTRWRGIAFGVKKGAVGYAWKSIWTALLMGLTVGWIFPWRTVALRRYLVNAMTFGSVPFRFEGRSGPLYGPFTWVWIGVAAAYGSVGAIIFQLLNAEKIFEKKPPISPEEITQAFKHAIQNASPSILVPLGVALLFLMLATTWYESRKLNLFAKATKIDGLNADLTATGASVLWLTLSNAVINLFSVGILRPVAQARRLRYLVQRFSFVGSADLDAVVRGQEQAGTQGAGLEAAFDIEIF